MTHPEPTLTASLTLIRSGPAGPEVFLGKRRRDRSFLPGFHAFFAGKVEGVDFQGTDRFDASRRAALRECFEESQAAFGDDALDRLQFYGWWATAGWMHPFLTAFFGLHLTAKEAKRFDSLQDTLDPEEFESGRWIAADDALNHWELSPPGPPFLMTRPLVTILRRLAGDAGTSSDLLFGADEEAAPFSEHLEPCGGVALVPLKTPTLPPATHTNALILGQEELLIVDPGAWDAPSLRPLVDILRDRVASGHEVQGLFLTHHHRDHVGGIAELSRGFNAPLFAHPETLARLDDLPQDSRAITDGESISLDLPCPVEALHTPGHAPGHLALHLDSCGIIAAGDLVASGSTIMIDPDEGSMARYLQSLRRLKALDPAVLIPAHGGLITDPLDHLQAVIDHRLHREALVFDALKNAGSATADDLIPAVYSDVPRAVWPLARQSLISHLLHLVEQDRATYDGAVYRWVPSPNTLR